jgi:hypothetical protein
VASGSTVTLSLTEKTVSDLGATPKVQLVKPVRDNSAQFNVTNAESAGVNVATSVTGVAANAVAVVDGLAAVKASKAIAELTFTADTAGVAGNSITVQYVAGVGNDVATSASVTGNAITVTLGTDGGGAVNATATDVKTAIEADTASAALVDVALTGVGTTVQTAVA